MKRAFVYRIGLCLALSGAFLGVEMSAARADDVASDAPNADFVLISTVKINPDQLSAFKQTLLPYMALTRQEEGCLGYFASESTEDPTQFMTYEHWKSSDLRAAHLAAPYTVQFFKQVVPMFQPHSPAYPIRTQYIDVR